MLYGINNNAGMFVSCSYYLILIAVNSVKLGQSLTVKQFQRLLGLMAASNVISFDLLYITLLQGWLRTKGFPRGATHLA